MAQATAERRATKRDGRDDAKQRGKGEQRALSPGLRRAHWIESPEDHEERKGQTLATRSHEVIRAWAEQRGAVPATVPSRRGPGPRTLRFIFQESESNRRLEEVSWEDWFRTFDDRDLVMLFQEHKRDGNDSNFFRFDNPNREDA